MISNSPPTLKEVSKKVFRARSDQYSFDEIQTGLLQRIADAVERVASNHKILEKERDYWKTRATELKARWETEKRRSSALKGCLNRMKKEGEVKA